MTPYLTIDEAFHPTDPVHEGNLARAARDASLALALPVLTVRSDKWGQSPAFHPLALEGLK